MVDFTEYPTWKFEDYKTVPSNHHKFNMLFL